MVQFVIEDPEKGGRGGEGSGRGWGERGGVEKEESGREGRTEVE